MMRNRRLSKNITPTFAVVVDGDTETWYFQMLQDYERRKGLRLTIKPEIPQNKSFKKQYELVCHLVAKEYTKVFWIVDLDTIIKESNEVKKGYQSSLEVFKKYRNKLQKKYNNVVVIVNNPCLEFWFLLHYTNTSRYFDICEKVEKELKKFLENYEKTEKFFKKKNNDIYKKLKPKLKDAIQHSSNLGCLDDSNPKKAMCEMELLFETSELKNILEN